jgi:aspartate/methionine/tyrosine aminotransferase
MIFDETYRDMTFGDPLPMAASLSPRVIGVSSLSKTYGLPGIRIGWLACRDKTLMENFLAAKEQIVICGSTLDEEVGRRALAARERLLPPIKKTIRAHFEMVKAWMARQELVEWVEPAGGVVCFPRLNARVNVDRFYELLNADGTWVGPGHWFEMERRYFRLGYGWPKTAELAAGLDAIARAAKAAV